MATAVSSGVPSDAVRNSLLKQVDNDDNAGSRLNWSDQLLDKLPNELFHLEELKLLILTRNRLSLIPGELPNSLPNLIHINLSHNAFHKFPICLTSSINLQILHLSHNRIADLPPELGKLSQLRLLNLDFNRIEKLPDEIGGLSELNDLRLGCNLLFELPSQFSLLTKLNFLYLDSNSFRYFPLPILEAENLKVLYLSHNKLVHLPTTVNTLSRLKEFRLNSNKLYKLPQTLCEMSELTMLSLDNNRISTLPIGFGSLTSLQEFSAFNNPLIQPPLEVCQAGISAVSKYQELLLAESQTVPSRLKVIVLGRSNSGKSSLISGLTRPSGAQKPPSPSKSRGVKITNFALQSSEFVFYDCGGDETYYLLHNMFLTEGALYLICVNVEEYNADSFDVAIGYWLNVVEASHPGAVVAMVATHADAVGVRVAARRCREIYVATSRWEESQCREIIAEMDLIDSVISSAHGVNALHSLAGLSADYLSRRRRYLRDLLVRRPQCHWVNSDSLPTVDNLSLSGMEELRTLLVSLSSNLRLFPKQRTLLPLTWSNLENLLVNRRKVPGLGIPLAEVRHLAESTGLTTEGLPLALAYFQQVGIIQFYPNAPVDDIRSLIFHDPGRLIDALCAVFHHLPDHLLNAKDNRFRSLTPWQFEAVREDLFQRGLVTERILSALIGQSAGVTPLEVIQLYESFDICRKIRADFGQSGSEAVYRVPWYLFEGEPVEDISAVWSEFLELGYEQLEVGCTMVDYCPPGVYERLSLRVDSHVEKRVDWHCGMLAERLALPLLVRKVMLDGVVKVSVACRGTLDRVRDMWSVVLPVLDELINLLDEFPGLLYAPYIACAHCVKKGSKRPHSFRGELIYQPEPAPDRRVVCPRAKPTDRMRYELLYPPGEELDRGLHSAFRLVAGQIAFADWRKLGRQLGLSDSRLDELWSESQTPDRPRQTYNMLLCWSRSFRRTATQSRLVAALKQAGRSDVAKRLDEKDSVKEALI